MIHAKTVDQAFTVEAKQGCVGLLEYRRYFDAQARAAPPQRRLAKSRHHRSSESMVFPHGDEAYSSVRSAQATNLVAVNMD